MHLQGNLNVHSLLMPQTLSSQILENLLDKILPQLFGKRKKQINHMLSQISSY